MEKPTFYLALQEPVHGFWDGGAKSGGEFRVDTIFGKQNPLLVLSNQKSHPGPGYDILWGSWELNFKFLCKSGNSWAAAKRIAMRKAKRMCRRPCDVEP